MDFFEKQARAQRRTAWLVAYFALAVVGIILSLHVVFSMILDYSLADLTALGWTALWVLCAVAVGSLWKISELSQGGRVVAAMLGGVPVDPHSLEPAEQRLMNVVEEMSIASGVPVPEVFVLEDTAINAFAAGHGPGDTAIGVTRGCIEQLTREELQGVIAHEFSHILHGDMKLNLRLIGVLNGILFLAILGGILFRIGVYSPDSGSRSRDGRAAVSLGFLILASGAALYLIGWIGVFFARLIKAGVSRQREFLADASAVQYTRNPDGLAGALAKIGKWTSLLESPRAEEASHMFFGNGVGDSWLAWFATHPPIEQRIAEIAPGFDVSAVRLERPQSPSPLPPGEVRAGARLAEALLPGQPQMVAATALLAGLPAASRDAVRDLHGACALVFSLLLSESAEIRARQLQIVESALREETRGLGEQSGRLSSAQKLALVDLAIPTLRHLSPQQYTSFRGYVKELVEADGEIQLFEYTLQKILLRHLDLSFTKATGPTVKYRSLVPVLPETGVVLSALATADPGNAAQRDAAFEAGVHELLVKPSAFPLVRTEPIDLAAFDQALDRLSQAAPDVKRTILTACGVVVMHDGISNDTQAELLRAIADTLDCPIPPFVNLS